MDLINTERRSSVNTVLPTRNRRCSYCRMPGHFINSCNAINLIDFEVILIYKFVELGKNVILFTTWLVEYSLYNSNILRAYAIRSCGCLTRDHIIRCIDSIKQNIVNLFAAYDNINEIPQEELSINNNISNGIILLNTAIAIQEEENANGNGHRKFNIQTNIVENADITPDITHAEECECNICYENNDNINFVKLNCGHEFCKDCVYQSLQNEIKLTPCCAFCRAEITNIEMRIQSVRDQFNDIIY
jgi:RING-type zinc-finger